MATINDFLNHLRQNNTNLASMFNENNLSVEEVNNDIKLTVFVKDLVLPLTDLDTLQDEWQFFVHGLVPGLLVLPLLVDGKETIPPTVQPSGFALG